MFICAHVTLSSETGTRALTDAALNIPELKEFVVSWKECKWLSACIKCRLMYIHVVCLIVGHGVLARRAVS